MSENQPRVQETSAYSGQASEGRMDSTSFESDSLAQDAHSFSDTNSKRRDTPIPRPAVQAPSNTPSLRDRLPNIQLDSSTILMMGTALVVTACIATVGLLITTKIISPEVKPTVEAVKVDQVDGLPVREGFK